jgi:hypothetical protein
MIQYMSLALFPPFFSLRDSMPVYGKLVGLLYQARLS